MDSNTYERPYKLLARNPEFRWACAYVGVASAVGFIAGVVIGGGVWQGVICIPFAGLVAVYALFFWSLHVDGRARVKALARPEVDDPESVGSLEEPPPDVSHDAESRARGR